MNALQRFLFNMNKMIEWRRPVGQAMELKRQLVQNEEMNKNVTVESAVEHTVYKYEQTLHLLEIQMKNVASSSLNSKNDDQANKYLQQAAQCKDNVQAKRLYEWVSERSGGSMFLFLLTHPLSPVNTGIQNGRDTGKGYGRRGPVQAIHQGTARPGSVVSSDELAPRCHQVCRDGRTVLSHSARLSSVGQQPLRPLGSDNNEEQEEDEERRRRRGQQQESGRLAQERHLPCQPMQSSPRSDGPVRWQYVGSDCSHHQAVQAGHGEQDCVGQPSPRGKPDSVDGDFSHPLSLCCRNPNWASIVTPP